MTPAVIVPGVVLLLTVVLGLWAVRRASSIRAAHRAASQRRAAALMAELAREVERRAGADDGTRRAPGPAPWDDLTASVAGPGQAAPPPHVGGEALPPPRPVAPGAAGGDGSGARSVALGVAAALRRTASEIEDIVATHESGTVTADLVRTTVLQSLSDLPLARLALLAAHDTR